MKFVKWLWNCLEQQGVEYVFGVTSSSISKLLEYIPPSIKFINIGNETYNTFIAQSYGKYSNKVGVLIVGAGPGISSCINGIFNSKREGNKLLVISAYYPDDNFQYINLRNLFYPLRKYLHICEKKSQFTKYFKNAYNNAINDNIGLFFMNSKSWNDDVNNVKFSLKLSKPEPININLKQDNENVLFVLTEVDFEDNTTANWIIENGYPFVYTAKGKYYKTYDYPYNFGTVGTLGNISANIVTYHATLIVVIGKKEFNSQDIYSERFSEYHFNDNFKYMYINKPEYIPLPKINNKWKNILDSITHSGIKHYYPTYNKIEKYYFTINEQYLKYKPILSIDVGNCLYGAIKYMEAEDPYHFNISTKWASIGSGILESYGIALATDKPVWLISGDGAAIWSLNAFYYCINKNIPITWIIFLNGSYSAVTQVSFLNSTDTMPANTDNLFDSIYEQLNITKYKVYNITQLKNALSSNKSKVIYVYLKNKDSYIYEYDFSNKKLLKAIKELNYEDIYSSKLIIKNSKNDRD
jgi:thiamine pyrophosphate-dependent acetolactate synthase large subunit-like protein